MTQEKATAKWRLTPGGHDIVNAEGVIVLKVWNGYEHGVEAVTAVNEHDALLSEVAQLKEALRTVAYERHKVGGDHAPKFVSFDECKREDCVHARAALAGKEQVR